MSIVRDNLMTRAGYSPYCGNGKCPTMPRTSWTGEQFKCGSCGWVSGFPADFIAEYKAKWHADAPVVPSRKPEVVVIGGGPSRLKLASLLAASGALVMGYDTMFNRPTGRLQPDAPKTMRRHYQEPPFYGGMRDVAAREKRLRREERNRRNEAAQGRP